MTGFGRDAIGAVSVDHQRQRQTGGTAQPGREAFGDSAQVILPGGNSQRCLIGQPKGCLAPVDEDLRRRYESGLFSLGQIRTASCQNQNGGQGDHCST